MKINNLRERFHLILIFLALILIFLASYLLHLHTIAYVESDFQGYALGSKRIFFGQLPYVDFFSHKPPLHFLLLLPANLIGGNYFSFFFVHLFYVAFANTLIYYIAFSISKDFKHTSGIVAWSSFVLLTSIQFTRDPHSSNGTLNGSILYPSIIFSLLAFIFIIKLLNSSISDIKIKQICYISGLLSACCFLVRFSLVPTIIFFIILVRAHLSGNWPIRKIALSTAYFAIGNLTIFIPILIYLEFSLFYIYDNLIKFNLEYSGFRSGILTRLLKAGENFLYFLNYCSLLFYLLIFSFLSHLFLSLKGITQKIDLIKIKDYPTFYLIIYFILELMQLSLSGTGQKLYPYFNLFVPFSILLGLSLTRSFCPIFAKHTSWILSIIFLVSLTFYSNKIMQWRIERELPSVIRWENEKYIANRIKPHLEGGIHDLFTLDFMSFLYLETNTVPPKKMHNFVVHDPNKIYNNKKLIYGITEKKTWEYLFANPPKVITRAVKRVFAPQAKKLLERYRLFGSWKTHFVDIEVYIRNDVPHY
jgi:hypothetical protein